MYMVLELWTDDALQAVSSGVIFVQYINVIICVPVRVGFTFFPFCITP